MLRPQTSLQFSCSLVYCPNIATHCLSNERKYIVFNWIEWLLYCLLSMCCPVQKVSSAAFHLVSWATCVRWSVTDDFLFWLRCQLLCRLPALAEATYIWITIHHLASSSASASQKISVILFSGTTQASFLIFGTEHHYGELYCVTQFWICGMSTFCLTPLWIFKRKEVDKRHMSSLEDLLLSWVRYTQESMCMINKGRYGVFELHRW